MSGLTRNGCCHGIPSRYASLVRRWAAQQNSETLGVAESNEDGMEHRQGRVTAWVGIAANIAVLLGLIFVGLEVRNSRASARAQAADGVAEGFVELNLAIITDTMVARVWEQGTRAPETLTAGEQFQFFMHIRALFNQYIRIHRLYEAGLLSEADWSFYAPEISAQMSTPGGRMFFDENSLPRQFLEDVQAFATAEREFQIRPGRGN